MNLQLSLKTKWFEMTKKGVKTEDYRDINEYWIKRLLHNEGDEPVGLALCALRDGYAQEQVKDIYGVSFKNFKTNTMTLGYPKKTDSERILKLEHIGIEIAMGNPEWGAIGGEYCFVIKHGKPTE